MSLSGVPFASPADKGWKRTMSSNSGITNQEANEMVEYYEMFKAYQEGEKRKIYDHTFKSATKSIERLVSELSAHHFKIKDIYLRFNKATSITVLLLVNEETFLSDEFDAAYKVARKVEDGAKDDIFDIDFTFAAKTENTIEEVIACQGFLLKRAPSKK